AKTLAGTPVIVVPTGLCDNILAGEVPVIPSNPSSFGGHIIYTSGSTGSHKKLLLEGKDEDRRNASLVRKVSYNKSTISFGATGISSGVGFKSPSAVWHVGGCVVYDWRPDYLKTMFRHGVNSSMLTARLLKNLVKSRDTSGPMNHDCELLIGAGFLAVELAEKAISRVTKRLGVTYGASEIGTPALLSRFTATKNMHWLSPGDGRTIQIVDERGNECLEGELRIPLTDIDCTSYLDDREASAKVFRDGFFYPGDMAVRRADGRIRILGRVDDVVNVQGGKFAVTPIEHEIQ